MDEDSAYEGEHAHFYDAQVAAYDREDVSYYVEQATAVEGPVLELACGTGRIYLELLDAGIDADGLDAAEDSLAVLREKASNRGLDPSVWQGDMTDFAVERSYDLIICPFNAFLHLKTVDEQLSALRSIHDALSADGRFVFDVFVPSFDVICEEYGSWSSNEIEYRGATHTVRERSELLDEVEQSVRTEIELRDSEGQTVLTVAHELTMLPTQQVELLARCSPFSSWTVTGNFEQRGLRDGDSVQVWSFKRDD